MTRLGNGLSPHEGGTAATMSVHVVPVNDLIEHDLRDDCPCGPRVEPVERDDGSMGWLHVHHSLDDREQHEEAST